ncbi:hypothetical protein M8J77_006053 [Diaphorina citri]|nr:hypothetical protein M8J77_006053 [Diaphorina citri]
MLEITLPEVTDDISSEIDIDMPVKYPYQESGSKSKKRVNSASPVNSNNDKKLCTEPKSELQCLIPIIKLVEPSVDPDAFLNLIGDLKKQSLKKKLDIIKSNYDMKPSAVSDLLDKLTSDESISCQSKLKNKLKNLAKTISSATTVTNPAPDPTPSSQS